MSASSGVQHFARLVFWLGSFYALLNSAYGDNCIDAAESVLQIVLALAAAIDIQYVPGSEWDRFYELQRHCDHVETLLKLPSVNGPAILAGCNEAVSQLCYLLQMQSVPWATAVETLCAAREDRHWATITTMYSSC